MQGMHPLTACLRSLLLQDLAATCMLRGWPAVLRLVLPVVCAGSTPEAALARIEQLLGGMPVLHVTGKTILASRAFPRALHCVPYAIT